MAFPAGVVVSRPCWRRNRSILRVCSSARKPTKSWRLRPSRSTDQAITRSNSRRAASRHSIIECWPLVAAPGAAGTVILVNLDHLTAHADGELAQFALLVSRGLIDGGNAEIENGLSHGAAWAFKSMVFLPHAVW